MSKMRKLLAILLTFAMVLGMSITTFAAEATTITVNGMPVDAEETRVTYVQVVTPDPTVVTGWNIDDKYVSAFTEAFGVTTEEDAIKALIKLGALDNYNKCATDGLINKSQDLAKALKNINVPVTSTATKGEGGTWTIKATEAGLYVINAQATGYSYIPMAAYVGFKPDDNTKLVPASVTVKGSENKIEKSIDEADDNSVTAGDIVEWTATTEYPYYPADATEKTFWVEDTLTNAKFVENSVVVTVAGIESALKENVDYTINAYAETNTFKIEFKYNDSYAGKNVTIKYSALVGEGGGDVTNTIKSNLDPNGDYEKLDKVQVEITKVDNENEEKVLSGATFKIYKAVAEADATITVPNALIDDAKTTTTLYLVEFATGTTDTNGKLVFTGLDAQETYYIKETVAPDGYSLNDSYYKLNPTNETTPDGSDEYVFNNFANTTVKDTKLVALPSTGGIGTTMFTIGGCAIMIAAAYLFFTSRKREEA